MAYRLIFERVLDYADRTEIIELLLEYVDSEERSNQLIQSRGVIAENLEVEEAQEIQQRFTIVGARTSIEPMDTTGKRYRVRVTEVPEERLEEVLEYLLEEGLIETEEDGRERIDSDSAVADNLTLFRAKRVLRELEEREATADIEERVPSESDEFVVEGQVVQESEDGSRPLHGVTVRVSDQDVRDRELLGEDVTDGDSRYRIMYTYDAFEGGDGGTADLVFEVYNPTGTELASSPDRDYLEYKGEKVVSNVWRHETIDIVVEADQPTAPSEFDLVERDIRRLDIENVTDLTDEEVQFVARDLTVGRTDEESRRAMAIAFVRSHRLADEATMGDDLPPTVFYALLRRDLSQNLDDVLRQTDEDIQAALKQAIEDDIVPEIVWNSIDDYIDRFERLRRQRGRRRYEFEGRLVADDDDGRSLPDYLVDVRDVAAELDLGQRRTDPTGRFSFVDIREDPNTESKQFRIDVSDPRGRSFHETTVELPSDSQTFDLSVPVDERSDPGEISLSEVETSLDVEIPASLRSFLVDDYDIQTLADVRTSGGIHQLSDLPVDRDDSVVKRLDAHAYLSLLPTTIKANEALYQAGFSTPLSIANSPREAFVETVAETELLPDRQTAKRAHAVADAQSRAADTIRTDLVTERENHISAVENSDPELAAVKYESSLAPTECNCKECRSAISPAAYLTDLLDFTTTFVQQSNGGNFDLDALSQEFLQPFGDLEASCDSVERRVRQVRLCIEVLRRYLDRHPPTDAAALEASEREYRQRAYELLLTHLGTSRDDLSGLASDSEDAQRVADRLRVPVEKLPELHLAPADVSEERLEQLFGLQSTTNPDVGHTPDQPTFLDWRLDYLEDRWLEQDGIDDAFARDQVPIIDPDVIGPDDFRSRSAAVPGKPFDLWKKRRRWVDERIADLVSAHGPDDDPAPMFDRMDDQLQYSNKQVAPAWGASAPDPEQFGAILEALDSPGEGAEARATVKDELNLTEESFRRLAELLSKHRNAREDTRTEAVTDPEWAEVRSILVQAQKMAVEERWLEEESNANVRLGPLTFWRPLREPEVGSWSTQLETERPLIDPDGLDVDDLPEHGVGKDAIALWEARRTALDDQYNAIESEREANGITAALNTAYPNSDFLGSDDWVQYLERLDTDLGAQDSDVIAKAIERCETDLAMNPDEADHLIKVLKRSDQTTSKQLATATDWERLYRILTTAWKHKTKYPEWKTEEKLPFWRALKHRLPRWRASEERRRNWQRALERRSEPPVVDPDLLREADFESEAPDDRVKILRENRQEWLTQTRSQIESISGATPGERFKTMLLSNLGIGPTNLADLETRRASGEDISAYLNQLTIDRRAFDYLVDTHQRLKRGETLPSDRWENVYDILVAIRKRRAFAEWQREEQSAGVSISPTFFALTDERFRTPSSADHRRWRVDRDRRSEWEDTLETRSDQVQTARSTVEDTVDAVEEETLPELRDALLDVLALPAGVIDAAEWVTDRFLIDAKTDGCQRTTRVSQAIETVQGIVFGLRTGQDNFNDVLSLDLVLDDPDFEHRWEWLGSYETWKAAMGVYLYPENILHPALRKRSEQTPAAREFAKSLRSDPGLTPQDGQLAVDRYARYFEDVSSLEIEATCWATTRLVTDDRGRTTDERKIFYMIARGGKTSSYYWSAYDPSRESGREQLLWEPLDLERAKTKKEDEEVPPIGPVYDAVGAVPYDGSIYLFLRMGEDGEPTGLEYVTYDLDQSPWGVAETGQNPWSKLSKLKVNPGWFFFATVDQTGGEKTPPQLIVSEKDRGLVTKTLSRKGTEWTQYSWDLEFPSGTHTVIPVATAMTNYGIVLIGINYAFEGAGVVSLSGYGFTEYGDFVEILFEQSIDSFDDFLGVVTWGDNETSTLEDDDVAISVFWKAGKQPLQQRIDMQKGTYGNPTFAKSGLFGAKFLEQASGTGIHHIPTHNGVPEVPVADDGTRGQAVALTPGEIETTPTEDRSFPSKGDVHRQQLVMGSTPAYFGAGRTRVGPSIPSPAKTASKAVDPFDITADLTDAERQQRRQYLTSIFDVNANASKSVQTYIREAFYFVPMHIALQLQESGQYTVALDWFRVVYDYETDLGTRKIYPGLPWESSIASNYTLEQDWLLDPLNPHRIAEKRSNAYTKFTLFSIVRCLLDYADAEFTRDTAESVPRARTLYRTASKLLEVPELQPAPDPCEQVHIEFEPVDEQTFAVEVAVFTDDLHIETRTFTVTSESAIEPLNIELHQIASKLNDIDDYQRRSRTIDRVAELLVGDETPLSEQLDSVRSIVGEARTQERDHPTFETVLDDQTAENPQWFSTLMSVPEAGIAVETAGLSQVHRFGGWSKPSEPFWDYTLPEVPEFDHPLERPEELLRPRDPDSWTFEEVPTSQFRPNPIKSFCVPTNPLLAALRGRTESNLIKIRNCMNIAGMHRQLEPYSAPTDVESSLPTLGPGGRLQIARRPTMLPTPYRYRTLVSRAKELANQAQQIESAFLNTIEKYDAETYNLLKARQDAEVTEAGVDLQELRVTEARDGITLAQLQERRADTQIARYQQWINAGLNAHEMQMMQHYWEEANNQLFAALAGAAAQSAQSGISTFAVGDAIGDLPMLPLRIALYAAATTASFSQAHFSGAAATARARAQVASLYASHERRKSEWELQKTLAEQDKAIAAQQRLAAQHRVDVVEQEREIAELQADHANDVIEFLETKFTSAELYDWMSGILEGSYRYYLQQATAMAQLAENELAFERQELSPAFIESDYWEPPTAGPSLESDAGADRRGLTGSTRLLQDLTELDQHAFQTDERKHQLTKTISLAHTFPAEFQRLRKEGKMDFATSLAQFDRDFPGHYLRQLRRVRVSVIGLLPPSEGIKATLTSSGLSRTVTGGDVFRTSIVRRPPESVTLTSPQNATGLFELQSLSDSEMRNPFEGMGVATDWEFRLPRAANQFDYSSLADILLTFDYTALDSREYRQQVIEDMNGQTSGDRPFSFRQEFADQWYDLNNPEQTTEPMTVRFTTSPEDFPANIHNLKIQNVLLYFVGGQDTVSGAAADVDEVPDRSKIGLWFQEHGSSSSPVGGEAPPMDGILSARREAGGGWLSALQGKGLSGEWTLSLPNTAEMRELFEQDQLEDIMFVVTFKGRTPDWPE